MQNETILRHISVITLSKCQVNNFIHSWWPCKLVRDFFGKTFGVCQKDFLPLEQQFYKLAR